ncbi:hypothetical protein CLU79DRAFT_857204 [Phycomyces nitens]|nr:hypothetical protein CLU79DRAFT_857204 [Phycomyces nitens]
MVEIHKMVSHEFITRLMRYPLNVFNQTKILPIVLVGNIDGFSSKHFFAPRIFPTLIISHITYYLVCFEQSKFISIILIQSRR